MVTVVGVAYRGGIALDDIQVDFQVDSTEFPHALGFGVREKVTLTGDISESQRVRLERASRFCPVGQALTKGAMDIEDRLRWSSGEVVAGATAPEDLPDLDDVRTPIPSGTVRAIYLLDTKEYQADGAMSREGEAKVYVSCENLTRSSTWTVLAGHSSRGLVPPPFPTVQAAWAASTAATLDRLLPPTTEGGDGLSVRLEMAGAGSRGQSQGSADQGEVRRRAVSRRIDLPGTPAEIPLEVVQAALRADPVSAAFIHGGVLLDDEVVVA